MTFKRAIQLAATVQVAIHQPGYMVTVALTKAALLRSELTQILGEVAGDQVLVIDEQYTWYIDGRITATYFPEDRSLLIN